MAYNFKNLADVELLEEVPEGCTAFAEVDGVVKRVPSKGLGGEGGIKTAIIKDSEYDNALSGLSTAIADGPVLTYECTNMTFEEAYQAMASGEPLTCIIMSSEGVGLYSAAGGPTPVTNSYGSVVYFGSAFFGIPCIALLFNGGDFFLYWTEEGLSTSEPNYGGK